jgi:hypothetical protein
MYVNNINFLLAHKSGKTKNDRQIHPETTLERKICDVAALQFSKQRAPWLINGTQQGTIPTPVKPFCDIDGNHLGTAKIQRAKNLQYGYLSHVIAEPLSSKWLPRQKTSQILSRNPYL